MTCLTYLECYSGIPLFPFWYNQQLSSKYRLSWWVPMFSIWCSNPLSLIVLLQLAVEGLSQVYVHYFSSSRPKKVFLYSIPHYYKCSWFPSLFSLHTSFCERNLRFRDKLISSSCSSPGTSVSRISWTRSVPKWFSSLISPFQTDGYLLPGNHYLHYKFDCKCQPVVVLLLFPFRRFHFQATQQQLMKMQGFVCLRNFPFPISGILLW